MPLDPKQIEAVDDRVAELLRKKTPAERFKIALKLWNMAVDKTKDQLKAKHPKWREKELQKETAFRLSHEILPKGFSPYYDGSF